jgi:hypothetical protein
MSNQEEFERAQAKTSEQQLINALEQGFHRAPMKSVIKSTPASQGRSSRRVNSMAERKMPVGGQMAAMPSGLKTNIRLSRATPK